MKLFIIEDDINILSALRAKFSEQGFNVDSDSAQGDLDEIKRKVMHSAPDFIVLDLILPKHNGFDVVKTLKSASETRDIPLLLFTDISDEDMKTRGLNVGADYYIIHNKFNVEDFVGRFKKIITNRAKINL